MNTKVCIIYTIDPFGPRIGGIATFIKAFIKYAPDDFQIEFIGISSDARETPITRWKKLELGKKEFNFFPLFFEKDENKKTLIPLSLRFTAALKHCKLDFSDKILTFHRPEPALLFINSNQPKIAFIHTDVRKQFDMKKSEVRWKYFPAIYNRIEKPIIQSLDYMCIVSKSALRLYQSRYPQQIHKFVFFVYPLDIDIFHPINKSKEKIRQELLNIDKTLPPKGRWILFVGRLQKAKAPLRMIQAFAEYHKMDKENNLLIIGTGNLEGKVRNRVAELGLEQSVYFLGPKSHSELAEYYRAADAMLLTSNFEGLPLSVLEALGSGLPVVSTDVGEIHRVVKNGFSGEIVKDFSPAAITGALKKVLQNPGQYRKQNCLECISEYTPQKALQPIYELYRKLASKTGEK